MALWRVRRTSAALMALMALSLISALVAVGAPKLMQSVLGLVVMFICIGLIYWIVLAPYVALFHLLVYAGAVTILLVVAVMFVGGESSGPA